MHSADRARAGLEGVRLTEAAPERVSLGAGGGDPGGDRGHII
jgi:hypothetical protein